MTAHLTVACHCGRSLTVPCPTLADLPAAQSQMTGWSYDESGFVHCSECSEAAPTPQAPIAQPLQSDLFAEAAA